MGHDPVNTRHAQCGNTRGEDACIGTDDLFDFNFKTNGLDRMAITTDGAIELVGVAQPTEAPAGRARIHATTDGEIFVSAGSGESWVRISDGRRNPGIRVEAASTTDINATFSGGDTLTTNLNPGVQGIQIDASTFTVGDRVLIKDQDNPNENGVYVVTDKGSASTPAILQRDFEFSTSEDFQQGTPIAVARGLTNGGLLYTSFQNTEFELNVDNIVFTAPLAVTYSDTIQPEDIGGKSRFSVVNAEEIGRARTKLLNCEAATTADLNATYNGTDLTLTGNTNGALNLDGQSLVRGDRVLVKDQTDKTKNGIYVVVDAGLDDPSGSPFILVRDFQFDSDEDVKQGALVYVFSGSTQAKTTWDFEGSAAALDTATVEFGLMEKRGSPRTLYGGSKITDTLKLKGNNDPGVTGLVEVDSDLAVDGLVTATNLNNHALIEVRGGITPNRTTNSTTFVTLESASAVTFSGRPVLCLLSVTMFPSDINVDVELAIQIDSGSDTVAGQLLHNNTEHNQVIGFVIITPTAGSRTLRVRWRQPNNAGTLSLDANDQILLHAIEL